MFGPLSFPSSENDEKSLLGATYFTPVETTCVLCEELFKLPKQQDELLSHIFERHKLVIADVSAVADLNSYLDYWRTHLLNSSLKDYCSTMLVDIQIEGSEEKNEEYFLLSDVLPEDKELRLQLHKNKLEWVLEEQRRERDDTDFQHDCLFCRLQLKGTRAQFLEHLSIQHNLQLGRPNNLVFIDTLIDKIQQMMKQLQCLYCEKVFKDRNILKEHMRKKRHKRINPANKEFDCFYIANYLSLGQSKNAWKTHSRPLSLESSDESDWSDWQDKADTEIVCLFCEKILLTWDGVVQHMMSEHNFDYDNHVGALDFYHQVKLVNYIRRQVYRLRCITCDNEFPSREALFTHMNTDRHLLMPSKELFDQPEFFFPTFENDNFLCQLQDTNEDAESDHKLDF